MVPLSGFFFRRCFYESQRKSQEYFTEMMEGGSGGAGDG